MAGRGRSRGKRAGSGWEDWTGGYMEAKRQKLNEQFDKNLADETELGPKSDIFKGVAIHVDGYTKPSSDELKKIMRQHGGKYEHYMFKTRVTHVIATNLPDSKIKKDFKHCKVVKPEWITESVKAGRLLSYVPYQLYTSQNKNQQGMASFSTFSVRRETSTSSTLARMASIGEDTLEQSSMVPVIENTIKGPNDAVKSGEKEENNILVDEHVNYSSDSDSSDNEFCRLLANSKKNLLDKTEVTNLNENRPEDHTDELSVREVECKGKKSAEIDVLENNCETFEPNAMNVSKETSLNMTNISPSKSRGMAVAGEPEFISEFYNNSRLHHLSTWKAEFKSYVNELQKKGDSFTGREKLREFVQKKAESMSERGIMGSKSPRKPEKVIMHVDMDCFFVSVGLRKRPELRGKPVAVTHSKGKGATSTIAGSDPQYEFDQWKKRKLNKGNQKGQTGTQLPDDVGDSWNVANKTSDTFHSMAEIASCSYEARQAGLKNGMFMGKAKALCPELVTIPYDFEGYNEVSRLLYDIVASYTHDIEAVSCDEMLVDCTDLLADTGAEPLEFATMLRHEIFQKTRCNASAGIGNNILQAKMATRKAKPNGQYHLVPGDVMEFMKDQSVRDIPGVGWSMSRRLQSLSVSTCGDLQTLSLAVLQKEFGPKTGQSLYKYCRGQDDRQIKLEQERKSVSAEINYGIRFKNEYDAENFFHELSEEVHNRLKKINMKGKTITLKLMIRREDAPQETAKFMGHGLCNNISKSSTLPLATDDPKIIAKECLTILRQQHLNVQDLRGIGIQLQKLESAQVGTKPQKGSGSILNFTVSKADIPKTPAIVHTNEIVRSVTKPEDNIQDRNKIVNTGLKNFLITNQDRETITNVPSYDRGKTQDSLQRNIFSSIETQVNQTCSDKAQNLAEDLSRRRNTLIVPPLPSLNFGVSPSKSLGSNHILGSTASTISTPEVTRTSSSVPADYFPSPSQIDPEVLQELPPDIRKQIESEMKTRKRSSSSVDQPPGDQGIPQRDETPSCSYLTEIGPHQKAVSQSPIVALPSLSQLDESCFNALPEEIQKELKSAYNHQSTAAKSPTSRRDSVTLTSPNKNQSPGRAKKNSPVFKVPKGRPARGRPKKLDFVSKKQPRINSKISNKPASETTTVVIIGDPVSEVPDSVQPEPGTSTEGEHVTGCDIINATPSSDSNPVNLCGAVSIQEVRALLKEWIHSSPDPEKDDEEIMSEYLIRLVQNHNLEQADLVLKFLHRHITRLGNNVWIKTFSQILDCVQNVVKGLYGSTLKI